MGVFAQGCRSHQGRVVEARRAGEGFEVELDSGRVLRARRVVDASGHRPVLLRRTPAEHEQVALGGTLRGAHGLTEPILMDFRGEGERAPTFLYALPLSEHELFVEETALITAERPSWEQLEARLRARIAGMGWRGELDVHERCIIGMDPELPPLDSPILGFGAAAGLVHPATGYQLAAAIALAEPFAMALRDTLHQSPEAAAPACWEVLWSDERLRARELQLFGAHFVAGLGRSEQALFFDAFFRLPANLWQAYLAHDAGLAAVCRAMFRVFALVPTPLRWRLVQSGASRPMPIVRPLLGV